PVDETEDARPRRFHVGARLPQRLDTSAHNPILSPGGAFMKRSSRFAVLAVFVIPFSLSAAEPLVVTCGRLLEPKTKRVLTNAKLVFDSGRVAPAIVPNAEPLDLSAYTCLPGLIDAHTHLLLQGDATAAEYDE